ncbi:MAG: hypothetical protein KJ963_03360 [Bacteroidetes bacterium]|nr:hypothetical protein [Bacteroidota bacterium]
MNSHLYKYLVIILMIAFGVATSKAGDETQYLTGNPKIDFADRSIYLNNQNFSQQIDEANKTGREKSPLLAGGLSLLIPGAGQIYTGNYVKGGMFLATEAALWIFSSHFEKKGDDITTAFENYADARVYSKPDWDITEPDRYRTKWDVIRYYEWSNQNKSIINPNGDFSGLQSAIISDDKTLPPWARVSWDELNKLERTIGKWYSHTLPRHGEQQYYELIGKYPQFNQGWDDATNANFTYGDPITENYKFYSQMRGTANDYYYKAKAAMSVVVVNHILSAVDAYFSARSFNSNLKAEMSLGNQQTPFGEIPVVYATIKLKF